MEILITGIIVLLAIYILVRQSKKKLKGGGCQGCSGSCPGCNIKKDEHKK